jgi:acetoacetate decarboxylase
MARLRYVKTLEQVKRDAEVNPEFLSSTVRSIRVVYETDPALAAALVPRPLEPAPRPEIAVTFSHVAMHVSPELTVEIASAIFGARAVYDGVPGIWLVTMPMTAEQAVLGGRDTYGEPKKIAQIRFERKGDAVSAAVTRLGIAYLEARGRLGESLGPRQLTEYGYTMKALPSCDPDAKGAGFDGDPLLVRLEWQHAHAEVRRVEGELLLRESPFDPVADLPVRRLVRMEYEEGTTRSNGRVLRSVPGEWLLPFLHQRYDDPRAEGIEVPVRA